MPIKKYQVTPIQGCKDIILRREVEELKGYLTELLIKSGEIKPTFSASDIRLHHTDKYVVAFSEEVKDIIRNRLGEGYLGFSMITTYLKHCISDYKFNKTNFINDVSSILNEDIANQYCDILVGYVLNISSHYPQTEMDNMIDIVLNNYVCTLPNLIDIMTVLLVECFDVDTIRKWDNNDSLYNLANYLVYLINNDNNLSYKDITNASLGLLSTLDLDTKKNIIGSIWNCIIDIINEISINDISEEEQQEGGVVNE